MSRTTIRKTFAALAVAIVFPVLACLASPATPNGETHDGIEVACDLPKPLRIRNTGGTDGAGLCVWASMEMAARYQNCRPLIGVFQRMQKEPGGGWPERVDRVMQRDAPQVKYRQYMGSDLDFIKQGIASGRPVCATYGYGELYGMQTIAHMVLIVHCDDKLTCVLDNNDPGRLWWMATDEFQRRFVHGGGGWAYYTLAPPPPPVPHN